MKTLATAIAATALIGAPAFAAPPPAPVYDWTGWYAGVNAGAGFGNAKTDFSVSPLGVCPFCVNTHPLFFFDNRDYPAGVIGGGQIGYNWQNRPYSVLGIEADIQGALARDSASLTNTNREKDAQAVTNYTTQIDWFGTLRARVGYVWWDGEVMSYFTLGLAYGEVRINGTNTVSLVTTGSERIVVSQSFDQSQINTGWVVGFGTEGKLPTPGWTYKVEGLYIDLGDLDATGFTTASFINFTNAVFGGQVTTHTRFTDGILRAGLNYKFF